MSFAWTGPFSRPNSGSGIAILRLRTNWSARLNRKREAAMEYTESLKPKNVTIMNLDLMKPQSHKDQQQRRTNLVRSARKADRPKRDSLLEDQLTMPK
jgi:hypothetical protein